MPKAAWNTENDLGRRNKRGKKAKAGKKERTLRDIMFFERRRKHTEQDLEETV